jgi:hypothetical protein
MAEKERVFVTARLDGGTLTASVHAVSEFDGPDGAITATSSVAVEGGAELKSALAALMDAHGATAIEAARDDASENRRLLKRPQPVAKATKKEKG